MKIPCCVIISSFYNMITSKNYLIFSMEAMFAKTRQFLHQNTPSLHLYKDNKTKQKLKRSLFSKKKKNIILYSINQHSKTHTVPCNPRIVCVQFGFQLDIASNQLSSVVKHLCTNILSLLL